MCRMKQTAFVLVTIIFLYSCHSETDDFPNYEPGRLIEVSHEENELGLVSHKYQYNGENITDRYYYASQKIYISEFQLEDGLLQEIHYSFENTENEYYEIDSVKYTYSENQIVETRYRDNDCHDVHYTLSNGKVVSCIWKSDESKLYSEYSYKWSGDNLVRVENQYSFVYPVVAGTITYVFEYSDIENPFYYSNIPRIMEEFKNPYVHAYELNDLVPKCSYNFPIQLTITKGSPAYDEPITTGEYTFDCRLFPNDNKPFQVKVINTAYYESVVKYTLTYEVL